MYFAFEYCIKCTQSQIYGHVVKSDSLAPSTPVNPSLCQYEEDKSLVVTNISASCKAH